MKDLIRLRSGVTFVELSKSHNPQNKMQGTSSNMSELRPGAVFVKEGPQPEMDA